MLEEQAKQAERTMNKIRLERQAKQLREIFRGKDIKTVSGDSFFADFNNKKVEAEIQLLTTGERTAEQITINFNMINIGVVLALEISEINKYDHENIAKISHYDGVVVISIDRIKSDSVCLKDTIYIEYWV